MHFDDSDAGPRIARSVTRRTLLGAAATAAADPALAEECRVGPPLHSQGPSVWMNLDQVELDAAYDQAFYAPLGSQILAKLASNSELTRRRLGAGKPVELIEAANYNHFEMNESVGNPYGPNGRAALALMKLAAA
ncbi:MAG TPA: hypothetical protein VMF32_21250 [Xanthobacteraceae bacterium]|nr:hypothetical protein [Xanthobacteraceae bacterium]